MTDERKNFEENAKKVARGVFLDENDEKNLWEQLEPLLLGGGSLNEKTAGIEKLEAESAKSKKGIINQAVILAPVFRRAELLVKLRYWATFDNTASINAESSHRSVDTCRTLEEAMTDLGIDPFGDMFDRAHASIDNLEGAPKFDEEYYKAAVASLEVAIGEPFIDVHNTNMDNARDDAQKLFEANPHISVDPGNLFMDPADGKMKIKPEVLEKYDPNRQKTEKPTTEELHKEAMAEMRERHPELDSDKTWEAFDEWLGKSDHMSPRWEDQRKAIIETIDPEKLPKPNEKELEEAEARMLDQVGTAADKDTPEFQEGMRGIAEELAGERYLEGFAGEHDLLMEGQYDEALLGHDRDDGNRRRRSERPEEPFSLEKGKKAPLVGSLPTYEVKKEITSGIEPLDQFLRLIKPLTDMVIVAMRMPFGIAHDLIKDFQKSAADHRDHRAHTRKAMLGLRDIGLANAADINAFNGTKGIHEKDEFACKILHDLLLEGLNRKRVYDGNDEVGHFFDPEWTEDSQYMLHGFMLTKLREMDDACNSICSATGCTDAAKKAAKKTRDDGQAQLLITMSTLLELFNKKGDETFDRAFQSIIQHYDSKLKSRGYGKTNPFGEGNVDDPDIQAEMESISHMFEQRETSRLNNESLAEILSRMGGRPGGT